ncbi:MAG: arginine--tRNA ligase, partial [Oscillospiraceae bacterium]|nr:arginine--tRNA ligase [Oscillospiraceae bacterium]
MFDPGNIIRASARAAVLKALTDAAINGNLPDARDASFIIEAPKDPAKGDLACNAALVLSGEFKLPPRNIAAIISEELALDKSVFEKVEIAGPGFINFFL